MGVWLQRREKTPSVSYYREQDHTIPFVQEQVVDLVAYQIAPSWRPCSDILPEKGQLYRYRQNPCWSLWWAPKINDTYTTSWQKFFAVSRNIAWLSCGYVDARLFSARHNSVAAITNFIFENNIEVMWASIQYIKALPRKQQPQEAIRLPIPKNKNKILEQ